MTRLQPIQTSFAAGKISPRFSSQVTTKLYHAGCQELTNFVTVPQGPFHRRDGSVYLAAVPGTYGRMFGFPVRRGLAYFIVVSDDGNIYIVDSNGLINQDNKVTNGNFANGLDGWTDVSDKGVVVPHVGWVSLLPGNKANKYAAIEQEVTLDDTTLHEIDVNCLASPYAPMQVEVGTTQGANDLVNITTGLRSIRVTFTPATTTVWVTITAEGGDSTLTRDLDNVIVQKEGVSTPVALPHTYTPGEIANLQIGFPPGFDAAYFTCPTKNPTSLTYEISTDTWQYEVITFTDPPAAWAGDNWPQAQTFYQGRWWVGGCPDNPEDFWGSESGVYFNFNVPTTGAVASDPLAFFMATKGLIEWMNGNSRALLIGTEYGEHIVTSTDGVVWGGDIFVEQQSAFGSKDIQAEPVGNRILYVSGDGRKIRELGYQWTDDGWVSRDITFTSQDITGGGQGITDIVFARNPNDLLMAVTEQRKLIGATYERGNDIIGWYNYETEGLISGIAAVEYQGRTFHGILIDRDLTQATQEMFVEAFSPAYMLDSGTVQRNVTATNQVTGVTHLADTEVEVIVDGALHPKVTLDANGDATLQWSGLQIQVGLSYTSYFKSMPFIPEYPLGSTAPMMRRWNKIFARIVASAKPHINGKVPPIRHPITPMGIREPLRSEDVFVVNLGWDLYGSIEITQSYPLYTMVTGLHGEMKVSKT